MPSDIYNLLSPVATADKMRAIDAYTIDKIGIPGLVLMENAGRQVVSVICSVCENLSEMNVVIVCGKGNNGGDGYVVARYLRSYGASVRVCLTCEKEDITGDAAKNLAILSHTDVEILPRSSWDHEEIFSHADIIVDAILGTGVKGALRKNLFEIVEAINRSSAIVFAIDLPTGMNSDSGAASGSCVCAHHTITLGYLKPGLLFSPAREFVGRLSVVEIGFLPKALDAVGVDCYRMTGSFVRQALPQRAPDAFKNRCGQVLVLAGSVGMTGAAVLSSQAVLRVGAGLVVLGIPASLNAIFEEKLTEVMTLPLAETSAQSLSVKAEQTILKKIEWSDVLAIGPGLSTHAETAKLVQKLLNISDCVMVLDADALNCLQDCADLLKESKANLVLTPHPGELSRLLKVKTKDILAEPLTYASEAATKFDAVVVLKGAPTVVAAPDGDTFINSTGNAGMATAGMGDVLTGCIAGLAAQGLLPLAAALTGVYLHGLAGDRVAERIGQAGLIASDVLEELPMTMKLFEEGARFDIAFI